jgi:hypothetical protein
MDSRNIQSILQDALEEQFSSSQIQLWPAVEASLVAAKYPSVQREEKIASQKRRGLQRTAFAILILTVLLTIVFITPQGRAFAQSILQFFVRTESDTLPVPTEPANWVEMTPGVVHPTRTALPPMAVFAADCGDFSTTGPTCSVQQIREKVDFEVKELGNIPEGMYFIGATGGPDTVFLKYEFENHSGGLTIFEEHWSGRPAAGTSEVGASAIVEKVQIGGLAGEYFRGSFVMQAGESVTTWDPDFNAETLRWVDGDTSYTLQYDFTIQEPIGKEGLVALAESMTTESVTKLPMPPTATPETTEWNLGDTFNLTIAQAEELAGFKLLMPHHLPEYLSLIGARYDSETTVVIVYFRLIANWNEPYDNGITLSQQIVSNPNDCAICDIVIGNSSELGQVHGPKIVGANSNLETVQIGDITGKYVEGVWTGTDCCGWIWDSDEYVKTLRWQINDMAFELSDVGSGLSKADLIAIAESLKQQE